MKITYVAYDDLSSPGPRHAYFFAKNVARLTGQKTQLIVPTVRQWYGNETDPPEAYACDEVELHVATREPYIHSERCLKYRGDILDRIKKYSPDIIHIWTTKPFPVVLGYLARRELNIPLIAHCEDDEILLALRKEYSQTYPRMLLYVLSAIIGIQLVNGITAIQPVLGDYIKSRMLFVKKPMKVIRCGAELDKFSPLRDGGSIRKELNIEDRPVVCYSGFLGDYSQLEILIEAIRIVRGEFPSVILMVIGDGDKRADYENLVAQLGLQQNTVFVGKKKHSEVPNYYAAADILVAVGSVNKYNDRRLPAKFPEYMAMGKPVIMHNSGIARQLADNEQVVKTYKGSAAEFAEKIGTILKNRAFASRLSCNARKTAESLFDWEKNSLDLLDFYGEFIASP
ncbi:MAG: glycosyltransferase [Candidatus Tritonobacter lacicola]|nr:glycosyltransferase [Candidatus Tritonobacter lacicola]